MTINEKVAYLKGMLEGMELESKESKLIGSILEVLEEVALTLEDIDTSFDAIDEELNAINDELDEIEDDLYEDEDDDDDCCCDEDFDDEDYLEVDCPNCGELLCIDDAVLEEGTIQCPACEQKFAIDLDGDCDCGCDCGCEE